MSRNDGFKLAGVGAVACAACCAGPILGLLTATGLATIAGFVTFGIAAVALSAVLVTLILSGRSRKRAPVEVAVEITGRPSPIDLADHGPPIDATPPARTILR